MKVSDNATTALKKFARGLLTTTCLTAAAAGMAQAGIINESGNFGATDAFGNSFALLTALPGGTTEVQGALNPAGDNDFFRFSGLLAGASYSFVGFYEIGAAQFGVLTSGGATLNALASNPASMTGVVPGDGMLVVQVLQNEQVMNYDLQLTAAQAGVPEPSTAAGAGLGLALAGAMTLRRKLAK